MSLRRSAVIAAFTLAGTTFPALAENYPAKPIRFVVPYSPGGPTDLVARLIGQQMAAAWHQPVVVENRAGANGNIAAEYVSRTPGDGYMLFLGNTSIFTINPHVYKRLGYDPLKDFVPVSLVVAAPLVLVVHPSMPATNVKELVAFAKSRPGQVAYASAGRGGIAHMAAELFKLSTSTSMIHVPYKGAGMAVNDLLGGQVALTFTSTVSTMHHVKAGRLRALGVTSAKRAASLPQIPAIAESVPGYEVNPWYGVLVPAGTPDAIVSKLNAEIVRIARLPDVGPRLAANGGEVVASDAAEFTRVIRADYEKWGRVAARSGADLE